MNSEPAATQLRLLGTTGVFRRGPEGRFAPVPLQPRRFALLAYLAAARPRGLHSRDTLIALLWPESDQASARHGLRNALSALRATLGADSIVTVGDSMVGVEATRVRCDLFDLEAALAARGAEDALERYGELLHGFHLAESIAFAEWAERERGRLREAVLQALLTEADVARQAGDPSRGARLAQGALALAPGDERSLRSCLLLLAAVGDRAAALRAFDEFAARLRREYDAEPAPETSRLASELRDRRIGSDRTERSPVVAMFPVVDGTADGRLDYLGSALTEELRRAAGRMPGIRLAPKGPVPGHGPMGSDLAALGRSLHVDLVIEARLLQPRPDEVEVMIELARVAERETTNVGVVRRPLAKAHELSQAVLELVGPHLGAASPAPTPKPRAKQKSRDDAYILYIRGMFSFLRGAHSARHADLLGQAKTLFEEALALDPGFGAAIGGLANYYAVASARGLVQPFREQFGHAVELCHRALERDPELAVPHVHFGVQALYLDGDWETALAEWNRAIAADPSYAEAYRFRGIQHAASGRKGAALDDLHEAVQLEPHMPIYRNSLGDAFLSFGHYEAAIVELRAALALDPNHQPSRIRLIRCHERCGSFADAVEERARSGTGQQADHFREALLRGGSDGYREARRNELREQLATVEPSLRQPVPEVAADLFNPPHLRVALGYAELGDWDGVRRCEALAVARTPAWRQWFTGRPELAPLYSTDLAGGVGSRPAAPQ